MTSAPASEPYGGLRLLSLHAHPDDEASKGAPTVAMYVAGGAEATLVCATGGEEGDILNPAMDRPEVVENLAEVRHQELLQSVDAIGFQNLVMLGYRDSGMPDSEANARPDCFWQAPVDEAVDRFIAILRAHRPHVLITYSDDQKGYQHPDHLRVHDISIPAFELAADPTYKPELGEPWAVLKMYYSAWSRARMTATHAKFLELGLESPFSEEWFERPDQDHRITARLEIGPYYWARTKALLAHATQVDPDSPFWFGLPEQAQVEAYPYDDYILGRSIIPVAEAETDLFAGVREHLASTIAL